MLILTFYTIKRISFLGNSINSLLYRSIAICTYACTTTNYFTRYVKRVLGMTPSQYKAKFSVKK